MLPFGRKGVRHLSLLWVFYQNNVQKLNLSNLPSSHPVTIGPDVRILLRSAPFHLIAEWFLLKERNPAANTKFSWEMIVSARLRRIHHLLSKRISRIYVWYWQAVNLRNPFILREIGMKLYVPQKKRMQIFIWIRKILHLQNKARFLCFVQAAAGRSALKAERSSWTERKSTPIRRSSRGMKYSGTSRKWGWRNKTF